MHQTCAVSPHTLHSVVLSRALLDRDLDPFPVPHDLADRALAYPFPGPGGGFDDDDPRWRRPRRPRAKASG